MELDSNTDVITLLINADWESSLGTTASKVEGALVEDADMTSALDPVCLIVKEFGRLNEGWDGPNSSAPTASMIEDALVVLQNWPVLDFLPEPSVGTDGSIALELYDRDGFTRGGVEITGEGSAIYSVIAREEVIDTGHFVPTSQTDMIKALARVRYHLGR